MGGHNKWSQIKRQKGANDAAKSRVWAKLSRRLTVESKKANGDANAANVRAVIESARKENMPKDAIERAISKGTATDAASMEAVTYECYGPGGAAVIIECLTDNKNRTVGELRTLFKSNGGSLAESGSVSWMFDKIGQLFFDKSKYQEDNLIEVALQAGAKDVASGHDGFEVTTETSEVFHVKEAFERVGMHPETSGFGFIPKSVVPIDKSTAEKLFALLSEIEDHEDVQKVHANFELPEREMAEIIENQK
jgi:YebC/PmpR family DNA-binding regulatory protein